MAMIESGKSKRVGSKLLQGQLTFAEAFKYARGLESADQHATKVENQMEVTVKQEVDKITEDRTDKKLCFNSRRQWPHQGAHQENAQRSASSERDVEKETILRSIVKTNKKSKPRKN